MPSSAAPGVAQWPIASVPGLTILLDTLPDALADALGLVIADQRREWQREAARMAAEARATIAELRAEIADLTAALRERADEQIARVDDALVTIKSAPPPVDIADVSLMVDGAVAAAFATLPVPQDGKSVDPDDVRRMVAEQVATLPATVTVEDVRAIAMEEAAKAVDALPAPVAPPPAAESIAPLVKAEVALAVAALPAPTTPEPIDYERIVRLIEERIAALPAPRDGVGVTGGVIDRDGALILTLSDGSTRNIGVVVGRPGDPGKPGENGRDGFGFDDLEWDYDGERTVTLRFVKGEHVKDFPVRLPVPLYRGIWREGRYERGDVVTFGGSTFVAQEDTDEKPEAGKAWRLAVKRGRDGKDGKNGERGLKGDKGDPGRDLTQMGLDGKKW